MDLFILIVTLVVLVETSWLVFVKNKPQKSGKRKIYVDTSALIDGRIVNIAKTGFISDDLVILKSVLKELQLLADSRDGEKRTKARIGLDSVAELERVVEINTEVVDDGDERKIVDDELLKYASENNGAIMTIDYNLIKVAEAEDIATLNINDLAISVRTEFSPGERMTLKITEKGSSRGQGIGHLGNGTMVVVDKAANKVGEDILVELLRFHETSAGKIIFAKPVKGRQN